jgi:hypothetical protein
MEISHNLRHRRLAIARKVTPHHSQMTPTSDMRATRGSAFSFHSAERRGRAVSRDAPRHHDVRSVIGGCDRASKLPGGIWLLSVGSVLRGHLRLYRLGEICFAGTRFAGTPMSRIGFLALIVASTVATWSNSQAAGSFQTKPAFKGVVTAGVATRAPSLSVPNLSPSDLVGGCGRGRVRDPKTHTCRGPADIR